MKLNLTQFFKKYEKLVFKIAHSKMSMVNYQTEFDDLVAAGKEGLIDAYNKLDHDKAEVEKNSYIALRISGSITDYIRKTNDLSRNNHIFNKEVQKTIEALRKILNKEPSSEEVASALNLSLVDYQEKVFTAQKISFMSSNDEGVSAYDNCVAAEDNALSLGLNNTEYQLYLVKVRETMQLCVGQLDEVLQKVYHYVYTENMQHKEIGEKLNLTESRISQLNKKLAAILEGYLRESLSI